MEKWWFDIFGLFLFDIFHGWSPSTTVKRGVFQVSFVQNLLQRLGLGMRCGGPGTNEFPASDGPCFTNHNQSVRNPSVMAALENFHWLCRHCHGHWQPRGASSATSPLDQPLGSEILMPKEKWLPPNQSPSIFFFWEDYKEDYKNLPAIKDGRKTASLSISSDDLLILAGDSPVSAGCFLFFLNNSWGRNWARSQCFLTCPRPNF